MIFNSRFKGSQKSFLPRRKNKFVGYERNWFVTVVLSKASRVNNKVHMRIPV